MKKIAIIPARGLGDLMILAGFCYNLSKEYIVQLYHPLIQRLYQLMPYVEAYDRPQDIENMDLKDVHYTVMIYEDSPFFFHLQPQIKNRFQSNCWVLNPVVTKKADYRFSEDYFFNIDLSFSENLLIFAKKHFLKDAESKNSGFSLNHVKNPNLVVMHATASKESKSWFAKRFLFVKEQLEKKGFTVIFATLPHESSAIEKGLYSGLQSLEELVETIAKAQLVIGNESGVCHLASALGTNSIVLCRNPRIQKFWGADYKGATYPLFPPHWIPNIKNMRLRDIYWRELISEKKVLKKAFWLLKT